MERAIVEEYFKVNYSSRFNVGRITRPGKCEANYDDSLRNCDLMPIFLFLLTEPRDPNDDPSVRLRIYAAQYHLSSLFTAHSVAID